MTIGENASPGIGPSGVDARPDGREGGAGGLAVDLASRDDDAGLARLLETSTLPGQIRIALMRRPSMWSAARVMGDVHQIVAVRDRSTGTIVAMAERSERRLWVSGEAKAVGYISGARIAPGWRGGTVLARGFAFLRELHARGGVPFYLTTIASANAGAMEILTSGRGGLPTYHPLGTIRTLAIPVRRPARRGAAAGATVAIAPLTPPRIDEAAAFLAREGARRQFFPVVGPDDLAGRTGALEGMAPEDVLLALRGERIAGVLARWDQRAYRQSVIVGYGGWMRAIRPLHNLVARWRGMPALPPPGQTVACVHLSLAAVEGNDAGVLRALIEAHLLCEGRRGTDYLTLGLHERDPLLAAVEPYLPIRIDSRLYAVTFDTPPPIPADLAGAIPHVELGTL